jgi:thymidylate synthase
MAHSGTLGPRVMAAVLIKSITWWIACCIVPTVVASYFTLGTSNTCLTRQSVHKITCAPEKWRCQPCHLLYQFYVANKTLSAQLYIRSSDAFLGLPFNIASVALLTHMLSQQCGLTPGEVVISLGDAHLYSNHEEQVATQLDRVPGACPSLKILRHPTSIYDYRFDDFELVGYDPAPNIPAPVAI